MEVSITTTKIRGETYASLKDLSLYFYTILSTDTDLNSDHKAAIKCVIEKLECLQE